MMSLQICNGGYSVDSLLFAHSIMMYDLVSESGYLVQDLLVRLIHITTFYISERCQNMFPDLTTDLLKWVENCELPMLIKCCVFHYEFEVFHPFTNGNGRIGRLWHTLLLSKWFSIFAWIPVESIIHDRQNKYYQAINVSNDAADSTEFIEFMLSAIKDALVETMKYNKPVKSNVNRNDYRWNVISDFLNDNDYIMNADVRELLNVASATANRILSALVDKGKLIKIRKEITWAYSKI